MDRGAGESGHLEDARRAPALDAGAREPAWRRVSRWLTTTRASDEEDRRRELALNWLLLASLALSLLEAGQRLEAVIEGGAAAADHGPTFVLACIAAGMFSSLLVVSRRGRQVLAAGGLLCAYYAVATWLFVAEGTEEPAAIVLCSMLVVAGGVLLGSRFAAAGVLVITATLVTVNALNSADVLSSNGGPAPGVIEELGIGGGLAAIALVLWARTEERRGSVQELLSGVDSAEPMLPDVRISALTVRELQVVRLLAAGRSNDEIARELFVSPRTVHTHVSNALRKTGCSNRTELAVLAIEHRATPPAEPAVTPAS